MIGELVNEQQLMTEVAAYEATQSLSEINSHDELDLSHLELQDPIVEVICGDMKIKCNRCKLRFYTKEEMEAHRLDSHSVTTSSNRFRCSECSQDFSSQGSLWKHMKIHTGDKQYVCDTCDKSFNQLANLQRHYLVHTGEKPFACPICDKKFSQQTNVDKHQVTHTKVKRFACHECQKCFTQRANLVKHLLVHSGVRPYQCPTCLKRYAQQANMKKHMLTHNKQKSKNSVAYLCAKCQKLYTTEALYYGHLNTCTGDHDDYQFDFVSIMNKPQENSGVNVKVENSIKNEMKRE